MGTCQARERDLEDENRRLRKEIQVLEDNLAAARHELGKAQRQLADVEDRLAATEHELRSTSTELATLKSSVGGLHTKLEVGPTLNCVRWLCNSHWLSAGRCTHVGGVWVCVCVCVCLCVPV